MNSMMKLCGVALAAFALVAHADNDKGKGKGHGKGWDRSHDKHAERRDDRHVDVKVNAYFGAPQRTVVREYYVQEERRGFCPPGLAKKHNGCMPPGQAKKWVMGRPLPREVIYYEVPQPLVVQIGVPPAGYKYVRVASDILMIAVGTGLVVDAITDLGRI